MLLQRDAPLPVPPYAGTQITSTTPGADFYKENRHQLIGGCTDRLKDLIATLAHPHYLEADNPKALGPDLVSHRGAYDHRNGIPENSIAALDKAYEQGFRSIELDIMLTSDRIPVLMHDFTTGRMTDDPANRLVSRVTLDELASKHLVIRNPVNGDFVVTDQKVAPLEQALDHVRLTKPGLSVYLDCKETIGEAVIDLLIARPELRRFTAVKVFLKAYSGGFDEFLGNLYLRHGIDPVREADRRRRIDLRTSLSEVNVVPVLGQWHLDEQDVNLAQFFPPDRDAPPGAQALASSGLAWLRSWSAMRLKVVEAVDVLDGTAKSEAMHLIRGRLAEDEDFAKAAMVTSYRYEDFSVRRQDGSSQYFYWKVFGDMKDVGSHDYRRRRGTAGELRHEGQNVLTDQPVEEAWAIAHDISLPRGHTGLELDVPPGTTIDVKRDAPLTSLRARQFLAEDKRPANDTLIQAVREGARADAAAGGEPMRHRFPLATAPVLAAGGLLGWCLAQGRRRRQSR